MTDKKIVIENPKVFGALKLLGYGSQGDVYKINIKGKPYAIKVFNGLWNEKLENYEQKLDIDIYSYISPQKILYINDEFNGYLMKFCKGKNLEQRKLDISIKEFSNSVKKLMEDTYMLSTINYNIYDTFISNVMYDEGFKMIDIDNYSYEPNKTIDEIDALNIRRLNQMLSEIFVKNAGLGNLYFSNVEFKKLMKKCEDGEILFEELFNIICEKANNIASNELTNISEVGKVLTKNKKI